MCTYYLFRNHVSGTRVPFFLLYVIVYVWFLLFGDAPSVCWLIPDLPAIAGPLHCCRVSFGS